jgi:hypothetical protein
MVMDMVELTKVGWGPTAAPGNPGLATAQFRWKAPLPRLKPSTKTTSLRLAMRVMCPTQRSNSRVVVHQSLAEQPSRMWAQSKFEGAGTSMFT